MSPLHRTSPFTYTKTKLWPPTHRYILLITAFIQFVSPILLPFQGGANNLPIIPPGFFFSIWGLITIGCLVIGLLGVKPQPQAIARLYEGIYIPLSITQVLFTCWLAAALSNNYYLQVLTFPIFLWMIAGLFSCQRALQEVNTSCRSIQSLITSTLGLYAGWSTPAVWLNIGSLLPPKTLHGSTGIFFQEILVVAAAASAVVGSNFTNGHAAYVLGACWALIGILISSIYAGLIVIIIITGTGLCLLLGQVIVGLM